MNRAAFTVTVRERPTSVAMAVTVPPIRHAGWFGVLLAAACLWVGACSSGSDTSPTSLPSPSAGEVELESFSLVNDARASEGISPELALDAAVSQVARAHSRDMRDSGFFGHVNSNGAGLRQRLDQAGISYSRAAENLVQVHHATRPASVAHQQLMSSPSHRENILSPAFRLAGVGVAKNGDTYWITQIFIKP